MTQFQTANSLHVENTVRIEIPPTNVVSDYAKRNPGNMQVGTRVRYIEPDSEDEREKPLYDADSEDEAFVQQLSKTAGKALNLETFERIIVCLERECEGKLEDEAVPTVERADLCLARKNILSPAVEDVHAYWLAKRRQRNISLLRKYQLEMPAHLKGRRVERRRRFQHLDDEEAYLKLVALRRELEWAQTIAERTQMRE